MSIDRFVRWGEPGEQGPPTIERVAQTARDFLGPRWTVEIEHDVWIHCVSDETPTFHLRSEFLADADNPHAQTRLRAEEEMFAECKRGFSVFFKGKNGEEQTSVLTGLGNDAFSNALADKFTTIIARWWNGEVEWPS